MIRNIIIIFLVLSIFLLSSAIVKPPIPEEKPTIIEITLTFSDGTIKTYRIEMPKDVEWHNRIEKDVEG